ncbi:Lrp/AsnC family transcriptional regulator [Micrococcus sp.]|uniref:Lrp/AsnC family transcriptional regulator n=1 Tax=Micrococcus sp. TaxID=1271 RepID=UPI0026DB6BB4|nr:Lrp/AsnC family transcriptional regulator [Micrococcus sp.]MDO4240573.1 Lrp/AsnC family transcriptional regulator [Micrococcus sp.]
MRDSGTSTGGPAAGGARQGAERPIDDLDRRLLSVVDADPAAGHAVWARRLGVSDRTAARRFRALEAAGVVRVRGRSLPGFAGGMAWLTRTEGRPEDIARLGDTVARFPHSRWVRLSRDGTQLMAGLVTPPDGEDVVLRGLTGRRDGTRVRVHELLRVWGPPGAAPLPARPLDGLDRALMTALARDGRRSLAALARELGVDATTVGRRRARLVADGAVYFEADIDPAVHGPGGDAMLWLRVEPGAVRPLAEHLRSLSAVRFVAATSGDVSLVAHVVLGAAADVVDLVDEELAGRGVGAVEIVPQGRTFKRTAAAPG